MEPFIDFGLFEFLAASGLAWVGRKLYSYKALGMAFLVISLLAPAVLIFVSKGELARWLAAASLAMALLNAAVLFPLVRRGLVAGRS